MRKLHVKITDEMHRQLKVKAAMLSLTIQQAVDEALTAYIADVPVTLSTKH